MDGELKNLKCNISQLAAITGLHRQTVVSRLSGVPLAPGSNEKNKPVSPDGCDPRTDGNASFPAC